MFVHVFYGSTQGSNVQTWGIFQELDEKEGYTLSAKWGPWLKHRENASSFLMGPGYAHTGCTFCISEGGSVQGLVGYQAPRDRGRHLEDIPNKSLSPSRRRADPGLVVLRIQRDPLGNGFY